MRFGGSSQAKLASTASKLEEADKKVEAAEKRLQSQAEELEGLRAKLSETGTIAAAAQSSLADLKAAQQRILELEREVGTREAAAARDYATLRGKMAAIERERIRAFEEVRQLKVVAKERNSLDADNKRMSSELAGLKAHLATASKEVKRLQQVEAARDRLQDELAQTTVMLADTEARMRRLEVSRDFSTAGLRCCSRLGL